MWNISNDRVRFEDYLRKRVGVEYMIVAEPQPVADKDLAGQGVTTGVWVIRKQDRQRASEARTRPGKFLEGDWQIEVLGTYFIVGENVYQAPSVFSIIENRLLSAMSSLHKMMDATSALPRYTPAAGYSYLPQSQSTKQTTSTSVAGTPARSREGSVAPGTDAQSLRSASVLPESQITSSATASNYEETRLLADSLRMTILYGDEYADENPIKGEPGSFTFSSSTAAVKKRRADEEAAEAKARAERELLNTSRAASPKVEFKVTAPSAFTTETKVTTTKGEKSGKSSKSGEKVKRRRSKAPSAGPSPTTPGGPLIGTPSSTT
jgi:mediator of RNA polymerase II transcription subunit 6